MKSRLAALAALMAVAGCASAPIVRTGDNEWEIGESGKDTLHRDATVWSQHYQRARTFCSSHGDTFQAVERLPPDGKFHFKCVEPPPPPPPPPAPPPAPPPVFATEQEIDKARTVWRECLAIEESPIDDMISDANTVATVLATRCEPEFEALLLQTQRGHDYHSPPSVFTGVRHSVALNTVLRERAKRRNPKAAPPPVIVPKLTPGTEKL